MTNWEQENSSRWRSENRRENGEHEQVACEAMRVHTDRENTDIKYSGNLDGRV